MITNPNPNKVTLIYSTAYYHINLIATTISIRARTTFGANFSNDESSADSEKFPSIRDEPCHRRLSANQRAILALSAPDIRVEDAHRQIVSPYGRVGCGPESRVVADRVQPHP